MLTRLGVATDAEIKIIFKILFFISRSLNKNIFEIERKIIAVSTQADGTLIVYPRLFSSIFMRPSPHLPEIKLAPRNCADSVSTILKPIPSE
jgi:hypothetical protein